MNTFNKILPLTLSLAYLILMTTLISFGQTSDNKQSSNTINVDTVFSKVQVSYVPFVSTGGYKCKDAVYDYSINIIGGYIKGVRKLELAGTFNIDRENVESCQLAGCFNLVGGSVNGFQGAGLFNLSKSIHGCQLAGCVNASQEAEGAQVAGLVNFTSKGSPTQISGMVNVSTDTALSQVAGLINVSEYSAVQVAGILNVTKRCSKLQLGLVNVSDSCSGIPVGLLSFTRNGYHKLEIGADEVFYNSIAYRGGVKYFHNIFSVSVQPQTLDKPVWAYGYGIGTSFGNEQKILLDIDLTARHVMLQDKWYDTNDIYSLAIGVDKKLSSKISLAAAITGNLYLTDTKSAAYSGTFSDLAYGHFVDHTYSNGKNLKAWIGGRIALRFF
jgi:hypothetical protein